MSEGFNHSVKVPRLYKTTANIVKKVVEDGASLKPLIYENNKHPNVQAILALASTCLQCANELDRIIRQTEILVKEPRLDAWLARILIAELFWGKKRLAGNAKPIETILRYENQLREALQKIHSCPDDLPAKKKAYKPRFVRVNTLMMTTKEAIVEFENDGFALTPSGKNYSEYLQGLACLNEWNFIQDFHMPELFAFAPHTQFHNHKAYLSGAIVLQDKASCLPAFFLNPMPGSVVLDLCAAPGMKTTHMAAIIGDRGKIYAAERNGRRYETLRDFVQASKAKSIKTLHTDSMTLTPKDCPNVSYILVDPSCSGSGLSRPAIDSASKCAPLRLKSLRSFQVMLLRHALLNFPTVKRVVYSTCSIFPEENEMVVDEALRDVRDAYKLLPIRRLLNNNWINFSSMDYDCKDFCLYARNEVDLSNGFFVAIFERDFNVPLPHYKKKPAKIFANEEINEPNDEDDKNGEERVRSGEIESQALQTTSSDVKASEVAVNDNEPEKKKKKILRPDEIESQVSLKESARPKNGIESEKIAEKNVKSDKIESQINSETSKDVEHDVKLKIPKKKKSKSSKIDPEVSDNLENEEKSQEKRKKKSKSDKIESQQEIEVLEIPENSTEVGKIKKKKSKSSEIELQITSKASEVTQNGIEMEIPKKKKSKSREVELIIDSEVSEMPQNDEESSEKKKKKSKSREIESEVNSEGPQAPQNGDELVKTKKKKSKSREIESNVDSEVSEVPQTNVELKIPKKKKSKSSEIESKIDSELSEILQSDEKAPEKKKKKSKSREIDSEVSEIPSNDIESKKMKKKKSKSSENNSGVTADPKTDEMPQEKRRKKSKSIETTSQDNSEVFEVIPAADEPRKKKKKFKKNAEIEIIDLEESMEEPEKRRKKRKNRDKDQRESEVAIEQITIDDEPSKKKEKKALPVD